ncbi:MAG: DUF2569 family protein [Candidatus Omnitrophica bacterium]|nr:DUF2569 family protein [Candidatus Omnitrophota bacterium]
MEEKNKISGIGGWLILPTIGIFISSVMYFVNIFRKLSFLGSSEYEKLILQYSGLGMLNLYELFFQFFALVLFLNIVWLFFRKKIFLPKAMISLMWIVFSFSLIDFIWGLNVFGSEDALVLIFLLKSTNVIGLLIASIIWTAYFLKSRRVKNTFINKATMPDAVYSGIVLAVIIIFAFFSVTFKKAAIKEMLIEKEEAPVAYVYPMLELKLADDDTQNMRDALSGKIPEGYELVDYEDNEKILLKKEALMKLDDYLKDVRIDSGNFGELNIAIAFDKKGTEAFLKLTEENIGKRIAIIYNGKVLTAPVVREAVSSGTIWIAGNFSLEEAQRIVTPLKSVIKNKSHRK